MPPLERFRAERDARIAELSRAGLPPPVIAERLSISTTMVRRTLLRVLRRADDELDEAEE